jgi:hypothetical protein
MLRSLGVSLDGPILMSSLLKDQLLETHLFLSHNNLIKRENVIFHNCFHFL